MAEKTSQNDDERDESDDRRFGLRRRGFLQGIAATGGVAAVGSAEADTGGSRFRDATDDLSWAPNQELPTFKKPRHLDVANVENVSETELLFLTTLQGAVNTPRPQVYLVKEFGEGAYDWLRETNIPYTVRDHGELVEMYADDLDGTIVYDPEVSDTINVATSLAGVKNAAVASPQLAADLESEHGLAPVMDLREQAFEGVVDAYRWLLDQWWDETTNRLLVGLPPDQPASDPTAIPSYYETVLVEERNITDASNQADRTIDLSQYAGETVYVRFDDHREGNGWGADVHHVTYTVDGSVVADFDPTDDVEQQYLYNDEGSQAYDGHRFADGNAYFVYAFDVPSDASSASLTVNIRNQFEVSVTTRKPPLEPTAQRVPFSTFRDYAVATDAPVVWLDVNSTEQRALFEEYLERFDPMTPYLGWFRQGFEGEVEGVELCSEHSVYVAPTDFAENFSVFGGTVSHPGPSRPQRSGPTDGQQDRTPPLENKVYVTLTFTEGDNLQYDQHYLKVLWEDGFRGDLPLNWSISPLLTDAGPIMLDYYQRTATHNDHLMCGPSGAGYMYPRPWPDETLDTYTEVTGRYMDRADLDTIYMLNREGGENVQLTEAAAKSYKENVDPSGIVLNYGGNTPATIERVGGIPVARGPLVGTGGDLVSAIQNSTPDDWSGDRPAFLTVGLLAWDINPTEVASAVDGLGEEYEIVRGDHFFDLYDQATQ